MREVHCGLLCKGPILVSVQSISVLLFITASFGKDMCDCQIAQLVGRSSGNPGVPSSNPLLTTLFFNGFH